jgi:metallo-beta-lactamase family protein
MRIFFCGADRTVTGSCHLLEINGKRILLDMGLYQGRRDEARRINAYLPFDSKTIDAIILSHGHLDHCGRLPVVIRNGFVGKIYATPATCEVARIVLQDAAKIQEEDAAYLNRRSRAPEEEEIRPLYTYSDVGPVLKAFQRVDYGKRTELGKDFAFTFYDAGHILGSAYVVMDYVEAGKKKTLLFTADIGRYNTPILRDPHPLPGAFDTIITESTYGGRAHAPIDEVEPQMLQAVQDVVKSRGRLIVPSFAVGRTQTVLWYVQRFITQKKIPNIPIYVDSPMGTEVSRVTCEFPDNYDDETRAMIGTPELFCNSSIVFAKSREESKRINNDNGPCVIVASSPTCEFGRVLHHIVVSVERPQDMVLFTGWIPPETLGRRLQDRQPKVRILDRWYDVRCQVRTLHGLSAHADGDELLQFLKPTLVPSTTAFVVHGEADQAETFARRLVAGGIGRAVVPAMESSEMSGLVEQFTIEPDDTDAGTREGQSARME